MLRDMIDVTDDKCFTQGTIFNCAYSASYPNNETLGLIITARCDIANTDKVKFYNFIPAIPFEIWKEKDLLPIIKKQTYKNLTSQYLSLLNDAGFSKNNLETYGYDRIYDLIVEKKILKSKQLTRLESLKEKIDSIEQNDSYAKLISFFRDDISKILNDIIENKNPDFFFIDDIVGYNSVVVNLREIYELSILTAKKIPNGIEIDDGDTYPGLNLNVPNKFCSIVGQMKSPFIELLMQRFTNNFVRVGVDNHHLSILTKIMDA
ncbi:hypothetical protein QY873_06275 [Klebsiella pneumoniae subsp. pneumoniae]|uniref:hypothetical protein n=1 Tax=Enterobacteriaceae TaxID=543 RepID=UPI0007356001|nr:MULTISPECIES: hypothetical protein [Enterobacteriaceae]KTJ30749.1 hypothetical protein ASU88_08810 [Enterobacter hormaechei subsp. xiangfangensis]MCQ4401480.1 hypothetical protein [Enterobacter cloacae]MDN8120497.1 hypothetical protein [Klebsiella pneumoniae subsp. pneumoniae]